MPKQKYIIRDFSGGMNTKRDPRDLAENESSLVINMSVDAIGKIKTAGGFYNHIESNDGSTDLSEYIPGTTNNITDVGGYGVIYFESDYSRSNTNTITETRSGVALALGTTVANGQISFINVDTEVDLSAYIPVLEFE